MTAPDLPPVRRGFFDARFGQLHYRMAAPTAPTGSALLCLHASPVSSLVFEGLLPHMATDRICVAPDTPGFGDSEPPSEPPEIEDYAAAMGDLIEGFDLAPVDVIGYHTGSETAVELALQKPAAIRRLVLVSAPIFTPDEVAEFREQYAATTIADVGEQMSERWESTRMWWDPKLGEEKLWQLYLAINHNPSISWWGHRAAFNYELGAALAKVEQPVLVLNPEDDLWEMTPRARTLLRNGRVHDLPGWNHGFLELHAAEVAALLRDFLDG